MATNKTTQPNIAKDILQNPNRYNNLNNSEINQLVGEMLEQALRTPQMSIDNPEIDLAEAALNGVRIPANSKFRREISESISEVSRNNLSTKEFNNHFNNKLKSRLSPHEYQEATREMQNNLASHLPDIPSNLAKDSNQHEKEEQKDIKKEIQDRVIENLKEKGYRISDSTVEKIGNMVEKIASNIPADYVDQNKDNIASDLAKNVKSEATFMSTLSNNLKVPTNKLSKISDKIIESHAEKKEKERFSKRETSIGSYTTNSSQPERNDSTRSNTLYQTADSLTSQGSRRGSFDSRNSLSRSSSASDPGTNSHYVVPRLERSASAPEPKPTRAVPALPQGTQTKPEIVYSELPTNPSPVNPGRDTATPMNTPQLKRMERGKSL